MVATPEIPQNMVATAEKLILKKVIALGITRYHNRPGVRFLVIYQHLTHCDYYATPAPP